jgi:hypothetical protein
VVHPRVTAEAITGDAACCKSKGGESQFLVPWVGEPLDYGNQNTAAIWCDRDLWGVADALSQHVLDLLDGTVSFLYDVRNPLTTGVKQAVPYRTGREARYLSVSTE